MKTTLVFFAIGLVAASFSRQCGAQEPREPADAVKFRENYKASIRKLDSAYHGFSFMEEHRVYAGGTQRTDRVIFMNRARCYRVDIESATGPKAAIVACPYDVFQVRDTGVALFSTEVRKNAPARFSLITARMDYATGVKDLSHRAALLSAPTYFYTSTIEEFMNLPQFQFTRAQTLRTNGGAAMKLEWDCPIISKSQNTSHRNGYFIASEQSKWLPTEYAVFFGRHDSSRLKRVIHYGANVHGYPFASRLEKYRSGEARPSEVVVLSHLSDQLPSPDTFTREAFGLAPGRQGGSWLWVIAIVLACCVAGLLGVRRKIRGNSVRLRK